MGELPPRPEHLGAQIGHPALHRQGGNDDDDHPGETFSVAVLRAGSVPTGSRGPRPALLRLRYNTISGIIILYPASSGSEYVPAVDSLNEISDSGYERDDDWRPKVRLEFTHVKLDQSYGEISIGHEINLEQLEPPQSWLNII